MAHKSDEQIARERNISVEELVRRRIQHGPALELARAAMQKIDPKSIRRCPCGFEGTPKEMQGHGHGRKNRPECQGKIVTVWEPSQEEGITPKSQRPQSTPEAQGPQESPEDNLTPKSQQPQEVQEPQATTRAPVYEYQGIDDELPEQIPDDPEVIARRYLEQLNKEAPAGVGGDGQGKLEGDLIVETTTGPVSLQKVRQTVELPPVVLVWYDYYKNQGWMQGDGSISAFVTDFLLDHIRNCLGMRVIIVNEMEVQIVEQSRAE